MSRARMTNTQRGILLLAPALAAVLVGLAAEDSKTKPGPAGKFVDITAKTGIKFLHRADPTPRKYLLETMG